VKLNFLDVLGSTRKKLGAANLKECETQGEISDRERDYEGWKE